MALPFLMLAKLLAPVLLPKAVDAISSGNPTAGKVAEAAIDIAAKVVGFPIESQADAVRARQVIEQDPALALEMMKAQGRDLVDLLALDNADRADARAMAMATGDNTARVLAFCIIGGFLCAVISILAAVIFGDPNLRDPTVAGLVGTVLGFLSAKAEQVTSYHFGSSAGSKSKDAQMAALAANKET
jgi:hypothetical protein